MSISFFSNRLRPASVVPPGEVTASLKFLGEFSVILMSSALPMNVSIASFLLTSLDKPIFSPAKIKDSKIHGKGIFAKEDINKAYTKIQKLYFLFHDH